MNETLAGRWLRRYKFFFFIGLLIVCGQLILAYLLPIFSATDDILPPQSTGVEQRQSSTQHNNNGDFGGGGGSQFIVSSIENNNKNDNDDEDSYLKQAPISQHRKQQQPTATAVTKDFIVSSILAAPTLFNSVLTSLSSLSPPPITSPSPTSSSLNTPQNLMNNKKYHLRLGELDFIPNCDINTKEAVSAIHRARSQQCKHIIANITCAIQAGTFYATNLPNTCPNQHFITNRALGCFRDEKKFRLLSGYYTNFKTLNSPAKCTQMCLQSGFLYAGVQYSSECFCGNAEPPAAAKLSDTECSYKCLGDSKQLCGGYFAINIFETGISKFRPQTAVLKPKEDEPKVRIAFLLTLNGRAVRQVHRLLKALYSPEHYYYIHVDARQDYMYRELLKLESHAPNIRLARKRFSTIWGGATLLRMLLTSMTDLLYEQKKWHWDFVINLSESDFLVKTIDKLVDFLTANRDRNFVKSHGREVQRFIQKQGLDKTFVECDTHMWRIGDRQLPHGIQIDGGSDWIALSRNFVEYVTATTNETNDNTNTNNNNNGDELISGLLRIFHHTLLPAESFFHTAIRNSHFCNSYVDNNLHVTNWKRRLGCKCQYKHVVDWCGCSPNDFKPDDWPRLLATESKQVFFARKFEPIVNQAILLKLESWLFGPHPFDTPNLRSYWQSIYNLQDLSPRPDESLLTIAESILGLKLASINERYGGGAYELKQIYEIFTYMDADLYRGFVIHASVGFELVGSMDIELWARPEQQPQSARSHSVGKRIRHLEVSTDFDQKEQMSRNFAKIMGQNVEPVLVMHLSDSTVPEQQKLSYNLTVLWINPAGKLVDVSEIYIPSDDSTTSTANNNNNNNNGGLGHLSIYFSKSNLKSPLQPGIWTAKLILRKSVLGKCDFMICPSLVTAASSSSSSSIVTNIKSSTTTTTTTTPIIIDDLNIEWESSGNFDIFLPNKLDVEKLSQKAIENCQLNGAKQLEWIDKMVNQFFIIKDICFVQELSTKSDSDVSGGGGVNHDFSFPFQLCSTTNWSSMAPDPKSDIYSDLHHTNLI